MLRDSDGACAAPAKPSDPGVGDILLGGCLHTYGAHVDVFDSLQDNKVLIQFLHMCIYKYVILDIICLVHMCNMFNVLDLGLGLVWGLSGTSELSVAFWQPGAFWLSGTPWLPGTSRAVRGIWQWPVSWLIGKIAVCV